MKTTNERFDEVLDEYNYLGDDEIRRDNLKTFIQDEKNLLLDQAIEELEKERKTYPIWGSDTSPYEGNTTDQKNINEGFNQALSQAVSKLKELKT